MINKLYSLLAIFALVLTSCGDKNKQSNTTPEKPESVEQTDNKSEEPKESHKQIVNISIEDYQTLVSSQPFVVVDFYTTWCRPCIEMAPHLKKIANEYKESQFKLVKLDAEKNVALSNAEGIKGYPTLKLYKDGREVMTKLGGMNEAQLRALFAEYL